MCTAKSFTNDVWDCCYWVRLGALQTTLFNPTHLWLSGNLSHRMHQTHVEFLQGYICIPISRDRTWDSHFEGACAATVIPSPRPGWPELLLCLFRYYLYLDSQAKKHRFHPKLASDCEMSVYQARTGLDRDICPILWLDMKHSTKIYVTIVLNQNGAQNRIASRMQ